MGVHVLLPFAEVMVRAHSHLCLLYCYLAVISLLSLLFVFFLSFSLFYVKRKPSQLLLLLRKLLCVKLMPVSSCHSSPSSPLGWALSGWLTGQAPEGAPWAPSRFSDGQFLCVLFCHCFHSHVSWILFESAELTW